MKENYKAYLLDVQTANREEMSNLKHMVISRLEDIIADAKRSMINAKNGDFNGIDIMCGNTASALHRIMRDASKISELRTQNSTISMAMMEDENE